ncbi:MAG: Thiamine-monophosphate kinase [Candidatus Omnitrophica bacterium]|nr:Thiamine-monophosphate kinase [Candidatus Omnitrophota bacterium]
MTDRTLEELGEFGWIGTLRRRLRAGVGVRVGIGDDAAVVRAGRREILLATDMILEDRHFKRAEAEPEEIGRKALAVNISDMAAMGARPTYAVVALGLPARLRESYLRRVYAGMERLARQTGVSIVGGDTNRSDKLVLSVALMGESYGPRAVTRSGARPGDVIFVTGQLGGSYRSRKHLNFTPRLKEARYLVEKHGVRAMMDLSDGLGSDLRRLCQESGVGARVSASAIPVSEQAKDVREALTDGEDFELLFTLPPRRAARLTLDARARGADWAPFHPVGRIVDRKYGLRLVRSDGSMEPMPGGYDHFGGGS